MGCCKCEKAETSRRDFWTFLFVLSRLYRQLQKKPVHRKALVHTLCACKNSAGDIMLAAVTRPCRRVSSLTNTAVRQYQYLAANGASLFRDTPYLRSDHLSASVGSKTSADVDVMLKYDFLQPTGSFKDRGISHLCKTLRDDYDAKALVVASGGNAGLAVARAGHVLGMTVKVVVPTTTKPLMLDKIRAYGADVEIHGANFGEANSHALELADDDDSAHFVHPFDHPLLWEGHSSIVDEIVTSGGEQPGTIIVSVGGGGLFAGVHEGLVRNGWLDTKIVVAETEGANCLAASMESGELVTLPGITSIATSLGSPTACQQAFDAATQGEIQVISEVFTDQEVVQTMQSFLDDHRVLVEPACAAALSVLYHRAESLATDGRPIAAVVCGGSGLNTEILNEWRDQFL